MIQIEDETFNEIMKFLCLCEPDTGLKLRDINKDCVQCPQKTFDLCQIISKDEILNI